MLRIKFEPSRINTAHFIKHLEVDPEMGHPVQFVIFINPNYILLYVFDLL